MKKEDLRIVQLGKFYPVRGGVEKVEYDLMVGLSEQGVKCDMMCAASNGGNITTAINKNADLICCKSLFKYAATMISPSMIAQLRSKRKSYNIVHIHHPDPMATLALILSGYKGRVIMHWHSDILKQKMLLKLYRPLQNWLLKRADLIVGTSPVYLKESPFLQEVQDKTVALPIGVDAMPHEVEKTNAIKGQYPGKKIVFSLGRLVDYKGYKYLVKAAKYLGDEYVVLIGGIGPLREDLQNEIDSLGLQERVKLLGFIEDDEVAAYYGACDLFCLPSIQKTEAFGIVQIEAMSLGKPVVTTKIPESGVAWVNEDGISGINVDTENAKQLADAIIEITANEETYKRYSKGALDRYNRLFTKELMISNCLDIYLK